MEQQNKRRTHMKLGVYCVLGVSVAGLMGMLIQGCKQKTDETPAPTVDTNTTSVPDTNTPPTDLSNQPPMSPSTNGVALQAPIPQAPVQPVVQMPVQPVTPEVTGGDYTVVKGDSLAKIAKKNGVSLKALEAANPSVKPTKLKVGQKLTLPAGGKTVADASAAAGTAPAAADAGGESYTVKSGDTLTKIAKAHGVKLKALQAANGLTTTKIKVGQKLTIPSKAEAAAAPGATPTADTTAPAAPVPTAPAPQLQPVIPAPAPAHN